MQKSSTLEPSQHLYRRVRAGLILAGSDFAKTCRRLGVEASCARQALIGSSNGPKGQKLRKRLCRAAGVK